MLRRGGLRIRHTSESGREGLVRSPRRATGQRHERDSHRGANARGVAPRGRESLPGLVRIVAPNAAARLQLRARVASGRLECAILQLTRVGCRSEIHEKLPGAVDRERMHWMI